jgi:hypothetical protein
VAVGCYNAISKDKRAVYANKVYGVIVIERATERVR